MKKEILEQHYNGISLRSIARQQEVDYRTVQYWANKYGIKKRTRAEANRLRAKQIDLTDDANLSYILGIIEGDGNVYSKGNNHYISLQNTSLKLINSFAKSLRKIGLNTYIGESKRKNKNSKWSKVWSLRTKSVNFVEWYKEVVDRDYIVTIVLQRKETGLSFLHAFYECEGGLYSRKRKNSWENRIQIVNTDDLLLDLCGTVMREFIGIEPKWGKPIQQHKKLYRIFLYKKNDVKRFLNLVKPCIKNNFQEEKNEY